MPSTWRKEKKIIRGALRKRGGNRLRKRVGKKTESGGRKTQQSPTKHWERGGVQVNARRKTGGRLKNTNYYLVQRGERVTIPIAKRREIVKKDKGKKNIAAVCNANLSQN